MVSEDWQMEKAKIPPPPDNAVWSPAIRWWEIFQMFWFAVFEMESEGLSVVLVRVIAGVGLLWCSALPLWLIINGCGWISSSESAVLPACPTLFVKPSLIDAQTHMQVQRWPHFYKSSDTVVFFTLAEIILPCFSPFLFLITPSFPCSLIQKTSLSSRPKTRRILWSTACLPPPGTCLCKIETRKCTSVTWNGNLKSVHPYLRVKRGSIAIGARHRECV